jgi:hypothetical protein
VPGLTADPIGRAQRRHRRLAALHRHLARRPW